MQPFNESKNVSVYRRMPTLHYSEVFDSLYLRLVHLNVCVACYLKLSLVSRMCCMIQYKGGGESTAVEHNVFHRHSQ